jgi:hypothetical protein
MIEAHREVHSHVEKGVIGGIFRVSGPQFLLI